jgi:hypothetical protein
LRRAGFGEIVAARRKRLIDPTALEPARRRRLSLALLRWLPALGGAAFLAVYLYVGQNRVRYPFEIEWMEGGSVDHVTRLLRGQAIYVAPSIDFVPYLYTPFYYYVGAIVSLVTGVGLFPLRLISFVAALACFALIGGFVWRDTRDRAAAVAAAGFYAATYPLSASWMELARTDSLALALLLGGAWLARFGGRRRALVGAGVLWGLTYLTKQSLLAALAPLGLWVLVARGPWSGAWVALGGAAVALPVTLYLQHRSGGWYFYYTLVLPRLHRTWWDGWKVIWNMQVCQPFALAALGGALWPIRRDWRRGSFYLVTLLALLAVSTMTMMHSGSAGNVLMTGYAGLALGFGLALAWLGRALGDGAVARPALRIAAAVGLVAALGQLGLLAYDPRPQLMTDADVAAGNQLVAALRALPGDVYVPNHGYYSTLAGKAVHAQTMAVTDILRSSDQRQAAALLDNIVSQAGSGRFAAVVGDGRDPTLVLFGRRIERYRFDRDLLAGMAGFTTRTGARNRPSFLYVRR